MSSIAVSTRRRPVYGVSTYTTIRSQCVLPIHDTESVYHQLNKGSIRPLLRLKIYEFVELAYVIAQYSTPIGGSNVSVIVGVTAQLLYLQWCVLLYLDPIALEFATLFQLIRPCIFSYSSPLIPALQDCRFSYNGSYCPPVASY